MLRSILDPQLIESAVRTDDQILEEEAKDAPSDDEDYDFSEGGYTPRYYGSIISWSRSEQLGPIGILYVVLALILVNGRVIPDSEWFAISFYMQCTEGSWLASGTPSKFEAPPASNRWRGRLQLPFHS